MQIIFYNFNFLILNKCLSFTILIKCQSTNANYKKNAYYCNLSRKRYNVKVRNVIVQHEYNFNG